MDAIFITLAMITSIPGVGAEYGPASDHLRRALMETKPVKKTIKDVERLAEKPLNFVGMKKGDLVYFTWALPIASQKISTKPFKNLKVGDKDWSIRPELEYSWKDGTDWNTALVFNYSF